MLEKIDLRYVRWGLIATLLALSYAIIFNWQRDYGQASVPSAPDSSAASVQLPDTTGAPAQGELPVVAAQTVSNSYGSDIVEINNGTLRLLIDKRGGDIVHVDLLKFKQQLNQPQPYNLLRKNNRRVYIAQSGLVGRDGIDASSSGRPLYQSASDVYTSADGNLRVDLTYSDGSSEVIKSFSLQPDNYQVEVSYAVSNSGSEPLDFNLFAQIMHDGQRPEVEGGGLGVRPYIGAALSSEDSNYLKYDFEDMRSQPLQTSIANGWIALVQHYFMSAWLPGDKVSRYNYSSRITTNGLYVVGFTSPPLSLAAGERIDLSSIFFVGPKTQSLLAPLAPHIELAIDYGWFWFLSEPLFVALSWFHSLVDNWGVAIILLTLLVKLIFFPLTQMSFTSMARMRKFAPQISQIREQCGDDRQKMSQEMMKLYKRERINPMSGCLPILVQMPVFIALYWTLIESVELRHAPFALWIHDLAVMDPYFVLPLLMGVTMFIQQLLSPAPPDPTQAKIMRMLPIIFTFFFLWFPAGLTLYWVVNNTLSIAQQYLITRRLERSGLKDKGK